MKKDVVKELKLKGKSREFIKIIIAILEKENVVNYKKTLQNFYNNIAWQIWYNKKYWYKDSKLGVSNGVSDWMTQTAQWLRIVEDKGFIRKTENPRVTGSIPVRATREKPLYQ